MSAEQNNLPAVSAENAESHLPQHPQTQNLNHNGNSNNINYNNNNNYPRGQYRSNYRNNKPHNPNYRNHAAVPIAPYGQPMYYPPQANFAPVPIVEKPLISPAKKHVPIVIKTKDGAPVTFKSHKKTPSVSASTSTQTSASSATAIPELTKAEASNESTETPTPVQNDPALTSAPVETAESIAAAADRKAKAAFQLQFLAQLKARKKGAASAHPGEESSELPKSEEPAEQKQVEPVKEPETSVPESKEDAKPVETTSIEESKPVETTINEEKTETSKLTVEVQQEEPQVVSDDAPEKPEEDVLEQKQESEQEPEQEQVQVQGQEKEQSVEKDPEASADAAPALTPVEADEDNTPTMSHFLETIKNATPISDPYKFSYSDSVQAPNPAAASSKVIRYDPPFLMQFAKLEFKRDDQWKADFLTKIYIPEREKSSKGKDSRSRSNGPLRGINLRNDFEGRANSRTGSKRRNRDGNREKSRRGDKDGSRRSRGGRGEKSEKNEEKPQIKLAPEDVKPLEKTANRWVPKFQSSAAKEVKYAPDGVTVLYDDEDLEKKIRSSLNKLSLEKFDPITDELIQLANQSKWETDAKALTTTVRLTFAKATDEPHWSAMYARFCSKLVTTVDPEIYSENYPIPNADGENKYYKGTNLAYRLLVSRCQTEYEKGWSTDLPVNEDGTPIEPELMSDEYYELAAQKRRGLGLVRFIGELYRLNLIKSNVIISCIRMLTNDKTEDGEVKENYLPQEDTLETLNQFLLTVGQKLEIEVPPCVEYAFGCIKTYIENPAIGSRIKYKFLDLIDLRKARWATADSKLAGPKTISQIHAEFNQKQQSSDRERSNRGGRSKSSNWGNDKISANDISRVGSIRKSGDSVSALRRGVPSSSAMNNDFTTVSNQRSRSVRGNAQAPPLSRSASTTSNVGSADQEPRQQSNSFAALMDDDDHSEEEEEHQQQLQRNETVEENEKAAEAAE